MNLVDQLNTIKEGIDTLMVDATTFDAGTKEGMDMAATLRKSIQELRAPLGDMRKYIQGEKKKWQEAAKFGSNEKKVEFYENQVNKAKENLRKAQEALQV